MLVLGDVHGERGPNRALLRRQLRGNDGPALQVGDLGCYDLPGDVWFVAGNNEDHDVVDRLRAGETVDGVHLVDPVAELAGLRVAGLSGNYAPTRYDCTRDELTGDRRRHFTRSEVEARKALDGVDVFLAHEAPHGVLEEGGYDVGCRPIDEVLDAVEPALCLVGHHHTHAEGVVGETRVVSLAPVWERIYELEPSSLALASSAVEEGEAGEP